MDKRISDDSREKLEADILAWRGMPSDIVGMIPEWLDRQAAITRAECDKPNWEYCETCERLAELQAKLDAYDETDMELPKDADGEYIRIGDTVVEIDGTSPFKVISLTYYEDCVDVNACGCNPRLLRHVKPRTIEDVLLEFSERVCRSGHQWGLDAPDVVPEYAAEIREMLGVDE